MWRLLLIFWECLVLLPLIIATNPANSKKTKRLSVRAQLPTIFSPRRPDAEYSEKSNQQSLAKTETVMFHEDVVTLLDMLSSQPPDLIGAVGRSGSNTSEGSSSSQPSLPSSRKRTLFRSETTRRRSPSDPTKDEGRVASFFHRKEVAEKKQTDAVPPEKKLEQEIVPKEAPLMVASELISSDPSKGKAKRDVYKQNRQYAASTNQIRKIEPIIVKRVGSASNSPRELHSDIVPRRAEDKLKGDATQRQTRSDIVPKRRQAADPSSEMTSSCSSSLADSVKSSREELILAASKTKIVFNAPVSESVETAVCEAANAQPRTRTKRTRTNSRKNRCRVDSTQNEDFEVKIAELVTQLKQEGHVVSRPPPRKDLLDSSQGVNAKRASPRSARGRSTEQSPRTGSSSTSRSKSKHNSPRTDHKIEVLIESLKNSSELVQGSALSESCDDTLKEELRPREIRKMIRLLKSSREEEPDQEEVAIAQAIKELSL